ncbi:Trypanosomal VSG domain containing protein, putative [Trypanosoma equiperdum]|uniref:Trypanosomal VSG domain containing protein, putative n=1 Tax=Trypanosoma equiperdum TaxID=5694 RepID=A0A1G4I8K6_TRYEQ|nr:Trypanosomal VSG domain containing protein, putative [Trypanosoma equiperdum]
MDINMSLSNPSWQDMFVKDKSKGELHANSADAKQKGEDYDGQWAAWLEARKRLEKAKQTTAFKGLNLEEVKDYQKPALRRHVQVIAEQVAAAAAAFATPGAETATLTSQSATSTLKTAAYGDATARETTVTAQQAFGENVASKTRAATCTTNAGGTAGKSVLATAACLCLIPNGGTDVKGACAMTLDGSGQWQDSTAAPRDSEIQNLAKYCSGAPAGNSPARTLRTALDSIAGAVIRDATRAHLGAFKSTDCAGQNNKGVCVQLHNGAAAADGGVKKLQWYATLDTLADNLIRRQATQTANTLAKNKIQELVTALKSFIKVTKGEAAPAIAANTPTATAPVPAASCSSYNTNATCPKNN